MGSARQGTPCGRPGEFHEEPIRTSPDAKASHDVTAAADHRHGNAASLLQRTRAMAMRCRKVRSEVPVSKMRPGTGVGFPGESPQACDACHPQDERISEGP